MSFQHETIKLTTSFCLFSSRIVVLLTSEAFVSFPSKKVESSEVLLELFNLSVASMSCHCKLGFLILVKATTNHIAKANFRTAFYMCEFSSSSHAISGTTLFVGHF